MTSGNGLGAVVFGTGFGCFTHVPALRAAGFEVRGLVGRDAAKTARRARQFDVPRALTSIDEALALEGVDAVTVATPPHSHAEIVLAAVAARKHVICEKPFARSVDEARQMVEAARTAGVVALVGTEFRFDAGQATLARAVAGGAVGEPRLATFLLHVGVLAEPEAVVPRWWADANQGGGWLGAHGSQVIDQIRVALGEFASVSTTLPHVVDRDMTAEDGFIVQFRMESGCAGVMQSTCADRSPPMIETRIAGTTGSAWIEGVGDRVFVADAAGRRRVDVDDDLVGGDFGAVAPDVLDSDYERMIAHGLDLPAYTRLTETFAALILGDDPASRSAPATFDDGLAALAVLDACRTSAATRTWVDVSV